MTPLDAMLELLARVGASKGAGVLVNEAELSQWPADAVKAMKSQKVLLKASPATSAVCPGCEEECAMPVHALPHKIRGPEAFIVCDKRNDINRVAVPLNRLEQWQATGDSIANLLADLLELRHPEPSVSAMGRWEVGRLKGRKGASHVVLLADGRLKLTVAGHTIDVAEVLTLADKGFILDKRMLTGLVDKPVGGAGDQESATQRRVRLKKRVQTEKNKGNKAFLKTVAGEEGISISRLKQLVSDEPKPTKSRYTRSRY